MRCAFSDSCPWQFVAGYSFPSMADTKKDEVVDHFETYEEYLDTFVESEDLRYLGEAEIARIIVELGYR